MTRRRDVDAFHEAWERGVPSDAEIATLIRTAEQVRASAADDPAPAFREALREQLMAEASSVLVAQPAVPRSQGQVTPPVHPVRRRLAGLTAAAVASVGAITLVNSSAQAVPGELLYPVKRGVENVQLSLKDDGAERGGYQLDRASERLREAEALAGDPERHAQLPDLLGDFTRQAEDGSAALFTAFDSTGDEQDIVDVTEFAERSTTMLTALSSDDMPAEYMAAWKRAAGAVTALADESSRLCGDCARADVDDLVRSVSDDVAKEKAPTSSRGDSAARPRAAGSTAPSAPRATSGSSGAAAAKPAPSAAPSPAPSTRAPGLRTVTDPVLGGLLGNEEQEGLVPGLLNGLLGSPKSK